MSIARNHVISRWGEAPVTSITGLDLASWLKQLDAKYPEATVRNIRKVMGLVLNAAVDERMIAANPMPRGSRRKKKTTRKRTPTTVAAVTSAWHNYATPLQVHDIATRADDLAGPGAFTLIVTAAYCGLRWGEVADLQRAYVNLSEGMLVIDEEDGVLHEVSGQLWLGDPKTEAGGRTIKLPPFLIDLLQLQLDRHGSPLVFPGAKGAMQRRSNWGKRVWRPACDGDERLPQSRRYGWEPLAHGLRMHDLRDSLNTWLISDGIPEVARCQRLGWLMSDQVQQAYSHMSAETEQAMVDTLQKRWDTSLREARERASKAA